MENGIALRGLVLEEYASWFLQELWAQGHTYAYEEGRVFCTSPKSKTDVLDVVRNGMTAELPFSTDGYRFANRTGDWNYSFMAKSHGKLHKMSTIFEKKIFFS